MNSPDDYEGKLTFKTDLLLTDEQLDEIKEEIDGVVEEAYENALEEIAEEKSPKKRKAAKAKLHKHYPYDDHEDEDGEPDGLVLLRAKSAPNDKGKRRFGIFDSAGNPTDVLVYGGSTIKAQLYVKPFYMKATGGAGATCYIQAVQVVALAGDAGGGGYNPFDEVEGGFVDDGEHDYSGNDDDDDIEEDDDDTDADF